MQGISASPERMNAQQRAAHIRQVVLARGDELRRRFPLLRRQDALGAGILLFALSGMLGSAALYVAGYLAGCACQQRNAFFALLPHSLILAHNARA